MMQFPLVTASYKDYTLRVIPAQAGIRKRAFRFIKSWAPAPRLRRTSFAGPTGI
jgi:hypothetical protein